MSRYRAERLDPARHEVSRFDCGVVDLNEWLQLHAVASATRGTAATWVWCDASGSVVGYYALSGHKLSSSDLPKAIARGGPQEVPAVLIGKLALDRSVRGSGLGDVLVVDALCRIVAATRIVAARVVVVGVLNERVAQFYEGLGFRREADALRLVMKVSAAEQIVGVAENHAGIVGGAF